MQSLSYWVMCRIITQGSPNRGCISDASIGFITSVGSLIFRRVIKDHVFDASSIFPSVL